MLGLEGVSLGREPSVRQGLELEGEFLVLLDEPGELGLELVQGGVLGEGHCQPEAGLGPLSLEVGQPIALLVHLHPEPVHPLLQGPDLRALRRQLLVVVVGQAGLDSPLQPGNLFGLVRQHCLDALLAQHRILPFRVGLLGFGCLGTPFLFDQLGQLGVDLPQQLFQLPVYRGLLLAAGVLRDCL
jgi:hypothetical protein